MKAAHAAMEAAKSAAKAAHAPMKAAEATAETAAMAELGGSWL
jgi:hypothetical protein